MGQFSVTFNKPTTSMLAQLRWVQVATKWRFWGRNYSETSSQKPDLR
jgi:hypothetical protein